MQQPKERPDQIERERDGVSAESDPAGEDTLIVVGIGASAGGLEALQALLPGLPTGLNTAYVIAQHLGPSHPTMLVSLLQRHTSMPISEVEHGRKLEADRIYITPPSYDVSVHRSTLRLSQPISTLGPKPSIDYFFSTLGEDRGDRSVGIILSGTGSDGAHGIRAVKAAGGISIAQSKETAKYDGMPRAAIDTGCVDLVLPPEKIGAELFSLIKYPRLLAHPAPEDEALDDLGPVLKILQIKMGSDFSEYKQGTIGRRVARRMALHKFELFQDYVRFLRGSPTEIGLLIKDILISVTGFFRDREAFDALRDVLRNMVQTDPALGKLRIWVPGCATGEEAYSIAILVAEAMKSAKEPRAAQIFATDIDQDAILTARRGVYPEASVVDIEPEILEAYFVRRDNTFQVAESIRETILFARQDLIKHPPFSHVDLISCRNVLIYFNAHLQQRIVSLFHYVLNPGGCLFLGKSETVGQADDLFTTLDSRSKIYRRRDAIRPHTLDFSRHEVRMPASIAGRTVMKQEATPRELLIGALAEAYGHSAVLLDERMEIVYIQGDVSPYLALRSGEAGLNIVKMAREEIRSSLRTLLHESRRKDEPVRSRLLPLTGEEGHKRLTIHVRPLTSGGRTRAWSVVAFEVVEVDGAQPGVEPPPSGVDGRVTELERELASSQEHLQNTIEQLETANEELQSMNEELQSANEELQSANEELGTTNEELITVNDELQSRTGELASVNADLNRSERKYRSLIEHMSEGLALCEILFGPDGAPIDWIVREVNSAFEALNGVPRYKCVGQRAGIAFGADWVDARHLRAFAHVSRTGAPVRYEMYCRSVGKEFAVSAFTPGDGLVGVIVSDITERKRAERAREAYLDRLNALLHVSTDVMAQTTVKGLLQRVVDTARAITGARLGVSGHEAVQGRVEVGALSRADDAPSCELPTGLSLCPGGSLGDLMRKDSPFRMTERELREHLAPHKLPEGHVDLRGLLGARLVDRDGNPKGLIMVSDKERGDFTEEDEAVLAQLATIASLGLQHIQARKNAEMRGAEIEALMDAVPAAIWIAQDPQCTRIKGNRYAQELLRLPPDANPSKTAPEGEVPMHFKVFRDGVEIPSHELPVQRSAARGEEIREFEEDLVFDDGTRLSLFGNVTPLKDEGGRPRGAVAAFVDIGPLKAAEDELRSARDDLERLVEERTSDLRATVEKLEWSNQELESFAFAASHDLQEPLRKIQTFADRIRIACGGVSGLDVEDHVRMMTGSLQRMQSQVGALLEYSRSILVSPHFESVDLQEVVRDILSLMEPAIRDAGVRTELGDLPTIEANGHQMLLLFQNLIGNALRFRGKTDAFIHIYALPVETSGVDAVGANGPGCAIVVEDNGIGFDEEYLHQIFSPFKRLHGYNTYGGVGMGLCISRKIVELHGGSITASSEPGKGSKFIVSLPIAHGATGA